jgi:hypothetical protein
MLPGWENFREPHIRTMALIQTGVQNCKIIDRRGTIQLSEAVAVKDKYARHRVTIIVGILQEIYGFSNVERGHHGVNRQESGERDIPTNKAHTASAILFSKGRKTSERCICIRESPAKSIASKH